MLVNIELFVVRNVPCLTESTDRCKKIDKPIHGAADPDELLEPLEDVVRQNIPHSVT